MGLAVLSSNDTDALERLHDSVQTKGVSHQACSSDVPSSAGGRPVASTDPGGQILIAVTDIDGLQTQRA